MIIKTIIFICLIFLTNKINSQTFTGNQKASTNCIINSVFPAVSGPNYYEGYQCVLSIFTCADVGNSKTVTGITLTGNILQNVNCDFTVFTDATYLSIGNNRNVIPNIFTQLPPNLEEINLLSFADQLPETIELPNSLKTISITNSNTPIPAAFFNTGALQTLYVENSYSGYSFPSVSANINLLSLTIPINLNYPSDLHQKFKSLKTLNLYVDNGISLTNPPFNFPVIGKFEQLTALTIIFRTQTQEVLNFNFQTSITEITTLNFLKITGNGFNSSNENPNFSSLQSGSTFIFENGNSSYLQHSSFPTDSQVTFSNTNVDFLNFEFNDVASLTVQGNNFGEQELPLSSLFNYEKLTNLDLSNNNLVGELSNEYCSFKEGVLKLGGNQLTGTVPACFGCMGGNYPPFATLFPNDFTGFNSSTPPLECSELYDLNYDFNQILKTDQQTTFSITGTNLGWQVKVIDSTTDKEEITADVSYPNFEFTVTIPQSAGVDKFLEIGFGPDYTVRQTFEYSYEVPVITGFSIENGQLLLSGSGFSFNQNYNNNVKINGVEFIGNILNSTNGDTDISFSTENEPYTLLPFVNLLEFNVSIEVGGQVSINKTLYYFSGVNVNNLNEFKLNSTGSIDYQFTLLGEFGVPTTNYEATRVEINGVQLSIISVNGTHIQVKGYPSSNIGLNTISVSSGQFNFESDIEYVETPTLPPTPSPTSPSTSSTSSDEPNSSSTISIPIIISILLIVSTLSFF